MAGWDVRRWFRNVRHDPGPSVAATRPGDWAGRATVGDRDGDRGGDSGGDSDGDRASDTAVPRLGVIGCQTAADRFHAQLADTIWG